MALSTYLAIAPRAIAETVTWAVNNNGTWSTASNWRSSLNVTRVPAAADDVIIDRPLGAYTISVPSGSQSMRSLVDNENLYVSGGTLAVSTTAQIGGTLTLIGSGMLSGGTWSTTGSGSFSLGPTAALSGITLAANMVVPSTGSLTVTNGLTLSGSTFSVTNGTSSNQWTYVAFSGSQTVAGTGVISFDGSGFGENADIFGPITLGPAITLRTGSVGGYVSIATNSGTISAQTPGRTLTVNGIINAGTLSATAGTLSLQGSWINTGTISVSGTGTLSLAGTFADTGPLLRAGSGTTVVLAGTLDRSALGTPLRLNQSTGDWLFTGTVSNTRIEMTDGATLRPSGTAFGTSPICNLNNVTFGSDWTVPSTGAGGYVNIQNGLTLDNSRIILQNSAALAFDNYGAGQTLGGTGEIIFPSSGKATISVFDYPNKSLTIGPAVRIHGGNGGMSADGGAGGSGIINNGIVDADTAGCTLAIYAQFFYNYGSLLASAGTITTSYGLSSWGTLGIGPAGKLKVSGNLSIQSGGHLAMDLSSLSSSSAAPVSAYSFYPPSNVFLDLTGGVPGTTYSLVSTFLSMFGTFDHITPGYSIAYSSNAIRVTPLYPLLGDANHDWAVDAADRAALLAGFANHLTGWSNGDFNADGVIDADDLALFDRALSAYQAGHPPSAPLGTALPEPLGLSSLLCPLYSLLLKRRRA